MAKPVEPKSVVIGESNPPQRWQFFGDTILRATWCAFFVWIWMKSTYSGETPFPSGVSGWLAVIGLFSAAWLSFRDLKFRFHETAPADAERSDGLWTRKELAQPMLTNESSVLGETETDGFEEVRKVSKLVHIDLVSALYPNLNPTVAALSALLSRAKKEAPCVVVFHADKKLEGQLRPRMQEAMTQLSKGAGWGDLGAPRCFFAVDPDPDHAEFEQLMKRIGPGEVTDAEMASVATAWNEVKTR